MSIYDRVTQAMILDNWPTAYRVDYPEGEPGFEALVFDAEDNPLGSLSLFGLGLPGINEALERSRQVEDGDP